MAAYGEIPTAAVTRFTGRLGAAVSALGCLVASHLVIAAVLGS
jgi:hypothetical protein